MVALKQGEKTERSESVIQSEIRLAVGSLPDVRVWRNNTGSIKDATGRPVQFGLAVGSADLICIVGPWGRFLAIEVKSADGRVRPEQKTWLAIVERFGGVAGVARSVEEAMALVDRARQPVEKTTAKNP